MVTQVNKSTKTQNIYKNFYDLISNISGFSGIVYPDMPEDKTFENKSDYPVVIIDAPSTPEDSFTFGKTRVSGTIEINIYNTSAKDSDTYTDNVKDKIETSKDTLADQGIRQVFLADESKDSFIQGQIRAHIKTLIYRFVYYFDKTRAY